MIHPGTIMSLSKVNITVNTIQCSCSQSNALSGRGQRGCAALHDPPAAPQQGRLRSNALSKRSSSNAYPYSPTFVVRHGSTRHCCTLLLRPARQANAHAHYLRHVIGRSTRRDSESNKIILMIGIESDSSCRLFPSWSPFVTWSVAPWPPCTMPPGCTRVACAAAHSHANCNTESSW